jgi:phosphoribosylformylglycinamidine synthase
MQEAVIGAWMPERFTFAVEVGFLPGVTDNVGATARECLEDFLKRKFRSGENVYSSQIFFISGKLNEHDTRAIVESLYNPLIQQAVAATCRACVKNGGVGAAVPRVKLHSRAAADAVNITTASEEELIRIGRNGIAEKGGTRRAASGEPRPRRGPLALSRENMNVIRDYFKREGRNPTDIELESLAQTWSEHCKHTIFADPLDELTEGLYKTYIKGATEKIRAAKGKKDFCASVFTDNSGAIAFDNEYLVTHKVETHNTPSALDPYGGAVTGIGGVNRDALGFGLGAKPIVNTYGFCLSSPKDTTELYRDKGRTQKMLSARRIMEGVVAGVNVGGNCSGIPTPQGFLYFDSRYRGKPLVFAGTVGFIPRKSNGRPSHSKRAMPGDYIVMVGGRVGRDGIHGATFSSVALSSGSPATAVQIGDPITQKKFSDAIAKEARDAGLYNSITDNGAGGLSCSVAEMARESNGCLVNLEKVPLKYPGLAPWQIWISESQERMTLAVPPAKWETFSKFMQRRGVEATIIGRFTSSGRCVVKFGVRTVMDIDMHFLHEGRFRTRMSSAPYRKPFSQGSVKAPEHLGKTLLHMLSRINVASFEFVSRQYDHEVQAGSVIKPLQGKGRVNGDASVTRPRLDTFRGLVLSQALYPSYSELDSYRMASCALDTAVRNIIAAGGNPDHLALLDNFCWSSSNDPRRLRQLKDAVRGAHDAAVAYGTPFISGKDSMFNDFKGFDSEGCPVAISVPPTLLISALSVMPDVRKAVSIDLKFPGDLIYLLGETHDELGGSEYFAMRGGGVSGVVPAVDAARNNRLYRALSKAIEQGLVASAISVHRGGLAVSLLKSAMAGELGASISLARLLGSKLPDDWALFSESQGRVLVSVAPRNRKKFEALFRGQAVKLIGKVLQKSEVVIKGTRGKSVAAIGVDAALRAYRAPLQDY